MTKDEVEQLERDHANHDGVCHSCILNEAYCQDWPCDAARLLARVRALEAGLVEYGRHKTGCLPTYETCWCGLAALAVGG